MPDATRTKLTPPEVATALRVKPATVISWIRSGELRAIDVARRGSRRPRYRIDRADLLAFEEQRTVLPIPQIHRKRRLAPEGLIEFF